ncbi:MAG: N-acetylmuramoyl-L-alanine amidase [Tissierellaceae bacterium]|nr:N-acetylmuramoyl-L-alanine amidase [Tissierellaceae bacterium]
MSNFRFLDIYELTTELDNYKFKQLHVHHTWKPTHRNFTGDNHIAMQQGMKNYHTITLGWADIGQHLTLFPDGKWLTGRPFASTPASIKGWNTGALAVEMVGNFDTPNSGVYNSLGYDKLQGRQKEEILKLIKYFLDKYGEDAVVFHRDNPTAGKTCPGTSLNRVSLIQEAKELGKIEKPHWGEKYYNNLKIKGIVLDEKRYDDYMTRAEAMALADKVADWVIKLKSL